MKPLDDAKSAKADCAVFVGISLDGFIAHPNGDLDWLFFGKRCFWNSHA